MEVGLALRVAGLLATVWVNPSDQVRVQGLAPVRAAWRVALLPGQMPPPPLTTAVGNGRMLTVLLQVLAQPVALVSVRVRVKVPLAPTLMVTREVLAAPEMAALPLIDQR